MQVIKRGKLNFECNYADWCRTMRENFFCHQDTKNHQGYSSQHISLRRFLSGVEGLRLCEKSFYKKKRSLAQLRLTTKKHRNILSLIIHQPVSFLY